MEVPIGETRFDQFIEGQGIVLILNNYQPVFAKVVTIHESKMIPQKSVILQLTTKKLVVSEEWWSTDDGQYYREMLSSIAGELPEYQLIDKKVILNFNYTSGKYESASNPQLNGEINSIIFPTSGRSGGGMPSRGGKSRKYYKKLNKKYKKSSKKYKKQRKSRKNKNKYSK
jgi:hypothetical protein